MTSGVVNPASSILVATALTKIHPGAGRSPGIVDLPVVRDPLGYPFVPGSMVKGPLRTLLTYRIGKPDLARCLFGPEVNDKEKFSGALAFTDLYPIFMPAASPGLGMVYVTTPSLLSRAAALLRYAGQSKIAGGLENLATEASGNPVFTGRINGGRVQVGGLEVTSVRSASAPEGLEGLYNGLNPLYKGLPPSERLLVVPEDLGTLALDGLLLRLTRVRLDSLTKTVAHRGLWTEEYLPWGTLFLGAVVDTGFRGANCKGVVGDNAIAKLNNEVGGDFYAVIGGKETVGSGLLRARILV